MPDACWLDESPADMKKLLWILSLMVLMTVISSGHLSLPKAGAPGDGIGPAATDGQRVSRGHRESLPGEDSSFFYDRLAAYGNWVDLKPYGYVWVPRQMGYRWRPYSDGYWIWTDFGWTWVSDQEWGDIPFHYGRWSREDDIGWFWVPGTVWGPAWVVWRSNEQYVGWAPLPPGTGLGAGRGFPSASIAVPDPFWVFLQAVRFQDREIQPFILPFERNRIIVGSTGTPNRVYVRVDRIIFEELGLEEVRRITGRAVPRFRLQDARQPVGKSIEGRTFHVYRPVIRWNAAAKPRAFLTRQQARQELAVARVFDPRLKRSLAQEAAAARTRQWEETRLLEISQTQEIKRLQQLRTEAERRFGAEAEKVKANRAAEAEMADLKRNHSVEKQQLTDRHRSDADLVKRIGRASPGKSGLRD